MSEVWVPDRGGGQKCLHDPLGYVITSVVREHKQIKALKNSCFTYVPARYSIVASKVYCLIQGWSFACYVTKMY